MLLSSRIRSGKNLDAETRDRRECPLFFFSLLLFFASPTRRFALRPFLIDYNRFHSVLRADPKEGSLLCCVVCGCSVTTTRGGQGLRGASAEYYHTGAGAYITRPPLSLPTGISVNLRLLGVTGRTETRLYMRVSLLVRVSLAGKREREREHWSGEARRGWRRA